MNNFSLDILHLVPGTSEKFYLLPCRGLALIIVEVARQVTITNAHHDELQSTLSMHVMSAYGA